MGPTLTFARQSLPQWRRLRVLAWRYTSLALMTFATIALTIQLVHFSAGLACLRVTNGITIGLILCTNPRRRTELIVIAFAASFGTTLLIGKPHLQDLGLAVGKLIEIFVATHPFRKLPVHRINLTEIGTLLKIGVYSSVFGSGASVATLALWMRLVSQVPLSLGYLSSWYCSDALGAAVAIPLFWSYRRKPRIERIPAFRYDVSLAFVLFCASVIAVFWQTKYPFLFVMFPMLMPAVYTTGFVGAAWAVLATTIIAVVATAYHHGPLMLTQTSAEDRVLVLQFYLAVVLITAFPFAALLMERQKLIARLKRSETLYRELARLDGLTQLPNRREFDAFLDICRQRADRQNTPLSLLLIDIDHFKKLNDQHGHTLGDEYLRRIAVAIASAVLRKTDLVARYGGEEFGVILDSCDDPGALLVAERIQTAIAGLSQSLAAENLPPVTVSIGMATTFPELHSSSKTLIDAADQGLYAAKRAGRNRVARGTNLMEAALEVLST